MRRLAFRCPAWPSRPRVPVFVGNIWQRTRFCPSQRQVHTTAMHSRRSYELRKRDPSSWFYDYLFCFWSDAGRAYALFAAAASVAMQTSQRYGALIDRPSILSSHMICAALSLMTASCIRNGPSFRLDDATEILRICAAFATIWVASSFEKVLSIVWAGLWSGIGRIVGTFRGFDRIDRDVVRNWRFDGGNEVDRRTVRAADAFWDIPWLVHNCSVAYDRCNI